MRVEGGCHCRQRCGSRPSCRGGGDCSTAIVPSASLTGFLHLIVPPGAFELLRGEDVLTSYRSEREPRSISSAESAA
jgi:hypothetical protein